MTSPSVVVVGVDGSPGSREALAFALAEASMRNATVHAVHSWVYPIFYGDSYTDPIAEYEAEAVRVLEQAVAEAATLSTDRGQAPAVTTAAREGDPVEQLLEASRNADLLVVGSRGHGGLVGLVLGSVSLGCVSGARCPVVVVPDPARVRSTAR
jgi:nucleotide-binding universal stress UspA family protein